MGAKAFDISNIIEEAIGDKCNRQGKIQDIAGESVEIEKTEKAVWKNLNGLSKVVVHKDKKTTPAFDKYIFIDMGNSSTKSKIVDLQGIVEPVLGDGHFFVSHLANRGNNPVTRDEFLPKTRGRITYTMINAAIAVLLARTVPRMQIGITVNKRDGGGPC